jgi:hypothetical protein
MTPVAMTISAAARSCLAALLVAACSSTPPKKPLTADELAGMDPLPLNKGAKWTYNVTVKRYDPDIEKEVTRTLQWVTEVVDAHEADGVTAYRIRGWPTDLESTAVAMPGAPSGAAGSGSASASGAPGATPSTANNAELPAPPATERTLLRHDNYFLWGATTDPSLDNAEGWFSWPVHDGERICPNRASAYCWLVSAVETGYRLTFNTGPDEQAFELEPGTGVSRFHYAHHGTVNEVDAKLVSYSNGK